MSLKPWLLAIRPATLMCSWIPVVVGGAIAQSLGAFAFVPWFVALAAATLIQIGTNFANDVFDFLKGADDENRKGPTRAVQAGLISPKAMLAGMVLSFVAAFLLGIYLVCVAGWPIVWIGIFSILSGFAYTGGPYPLGYNGLGDLFVFVFFGWVAVCGTVYAQMLSLPNLTWVAALPCGAISTAILVVNNIRDTETDKRVGKRTLAVRFGKKAAKIEYLLCMATIPLTPLLLVLFYDVSPWVFLGLLSFPLALTCIKNVLSSTDPMVQNRTLKMTALLLVFFGMPYSLGLML